MRGETQAGGIEARLDALERQVTWWRRAAIGVVFVLAIGGTLAFRQVAPGPIEATSLTLRTVRGAVTLSLRTSGMLEARFSRSADNPPPIGEGSGLVIVNPEGREVMRIGAPSARQLAP
jgi:hypothetical protein